MSAKNVEVNEFGEQHQLTLNNAAPAEGLSVFEVVGDVIILTGTGAPVNGTTGDNIAGPGSIYINLSNGALYYQSAVITNPTWNAIGSAVGALAVTLAGFSAGAGTVSSADTILEAFNKLVGNTQNLAVINNVLTGYTVGADEAVAATDTVMEAIAKLQGQINALE